MFNNLHVLSVMLMCCMFPSMNRDNQSVLQHVKNYKPPTEGQHIRILLYGPSGAGRSSFINSVQSVLQGKMCSQALVNNVSSSFTRQVWKTFDLVDKEKTSCHIKTLQTSLNPDSLVKSRKLTPRSLSLQSVRLDSDHIRWWECHSMVRVFDVLGMLLCC